MKKIIFSLASIAILAAGCQGEFTDNSVKDTTGFTAVLESFEDITKTSMTPERNIVWSAKDYIAVFEGRITANKYRVSDETAGTAQGSFNLIGEKNTSTEIDEAPNIAFYPHCDNLICSSNGSEYDIDNVVITSVQSYVAESFGNLSFPMAAVTASLDDHTLKFKNVMGAMRLQFTGNEAVKSIRIEGNNDEVLAGTATVTVCSNGEPGIVFGGNQFKAVTLDCGAGVQLNENVSTSFLIALPPVHFSNGFKVTVTTSEGTNKVIRTNVRTNKVIRSSILTMPALKLDDANDEAAWLVTRSFTESDKDFANPERGFYAGYSAKAVSADVADSDLPALSASTVQQQRLENRTIFYTGYYPTKYMESDISDDFLTLIRTNMQTLRDNGAKCILRFAYKDVDDEAHKPWDAEPKYVLRHIQQIKPILQEYGDVILCFQAGFVGVWGEWYYTSHFELSDRKSPEAYLGRKEIIDAMLEALPQDRSVALRTPVFTRMMYAEDFTDTLTINTAYNGSPRSRLCCFNDCFGASENDSGTFEGTESREFWKRDTRYVFMGGETCKVSDYCRCDASLKDMEDYHWSYLNSTYNTSVINRWETDGCMDEIKRRLGYRLSLSEIHHTESMVAGEDFNIVIKIRNTGFAAPMNPRAVELVLADETGVKKVWKCEDIDPRYWFAGETATIEMELDMPADITGKSELYLNLPDPKETLRNNPRFSIRLANDAHWDAARGYNRLLRFSENGQISLPSPDESNNSTFTVSGEDATLGNSVSPW